MLRWPSWFSGLCAGLAVAPLWQDPPPATPPPPQRQEPRPPAPPPGDPAQDPAAPAPAEPLPGAVARHPTEGVYALRRRVIDNEVDTKGCVGYLAITQRHLFVCVAAPGPHPSKPLLRAGVRSWKHDRELIRTTVLTGWLTDFEGTVILERPGTEEQRKLVLVQGGLRFVQDARNWLEFERLE